jgi:hypothetical protein
MYVGNNDPVFDMRYREYNLHYHATKKVFWCDEIKDKSGTTLEFDTISAMKKAVDAEYKESKQIEIMFDPKEPGQIWNHSVLLVGKIVSISPRIITIDGSDGKKYTAQYGIYHKPKFLTVNMEHIETLKRSKEFEAKANALDKQSDKEMEKLEYVTV